MRDVVRAELVVLLVVLFTVVFYLLKLGGEHFVLISDLMAAAYSFIAVALGIYVIRMYDIKGLHGRSLLLILMGISLWFAAEAIWLAFRGSVLYLLEGLRLAGYIPLTVGFFNILNASNPNYWERKKNLILVLFSFLVFSFAYLGLAPVFLGLQSLMGSIITNGYIIADFSLLFGIALLLKVSLSFRGGYLSRVWLIFSLAFMSVFIFDVNFALNYSTYRLGDFSEVFWLFSYILIAFGFYYNSHVISSLKKSARRPLPKGQTK